jgi:hypothetical protein
MCGVEFGGVEEMERVGALGMWEGRGGRARDSVLER